MVSRRHHDILRHGIGHDDRNNVDYDDVGRYRVRVNAMNGGPNAKNVHYEDGGYRHDDDCRRDGGYHYDNDYRDNGVCYNIP